MSSLQDLPADQLGTPRAHLAALSHHHHQDVLEEAEGHAGTPAPLEESIPPLHLPPGVLPLPPTRHQQLLGQGSAAVLQTLSSDIGAAAFHLMPDSHAALPPPLDLSLCGSLPHMPNPAYGLLGLAPPGLPLGLLPLPGLTLDQPLASFVIGKMEHRGDVSPLAPHLHASAALHTPHHCPLPLPPSHAGGADAGEAPYYGSQAQLLPLPLLVQQHHRHLLIQPLAQNQGQGDEGQLGAGHYHSSDGHRSHHHHQHEASSEHTAAALPAGRRTASPTSGTPAQRPLPALPGSAAHLQAGPAHSASAAGEETDDEDASMGAEEQGACSSSEDEQPRKRRRAAKAGQAGSRRVRGGCSGTAAGRGAGEGKKQKIERSSQYRGVTKHRRSGRYEAHIWVKELGRQVYLGGYEQEEHAAEAYDIAALKCKGRRVKTNFDLSKYSDLLGCIGRMSMEELVMAVRRQSQGFSRGTSTFRGVTHHPSGRWEARIGIPGSRHIYLGLYTQEVEAARAYDRALVRLRGRGAATNFALSEYRTEMADFHLMQGKTLRQDERFAEIQNTPALLERFLKTGCESFPELASPASGGVEAAEAGEEAVPLEEQQEQH